MTNTFHPFSANHRDACLQLFDTNCPQFFAKNERKEYQEFLDTVGDGYYVCLLQNKVVAAFGLIDEVAVDRLRLNWIMITPEHHGAGIGSAMMQEVVALAKKAAITHIDIAASHLSAPFFARFGAQELKRTQDGWGKDMHRVDMEWNIKKSHP